MSSSYYTRSQQQLIDTTPIYNTRLQNRMRQHACSTHNIDFDESSRLWNQNKVRDGQMYSYICEDKSSIENIRKNESTGQTTRYYLRQNS
jgi:hypothetical protein